MFSRLKPDSTDEILKPSHPLYSETTASYLGREPAICAEGRSSAKRLDGSRSGG